MEDKQENVKEQPKQKTEKETTPRIKTWGDLREDILRKLKKEEWI